MKRHSYDTKNPDFIWNKNRLVLEKEAIKRQMMNVIKKKPAKKEDGKDGTAGGTTDAVWFITVLVCNWRMEDEPTELSLIDLQDDKAIL